MVIQPDIGSCYYYRMSYTILFHNHLRLIVLLVNFQVWVLSSINWAIDTKSVDLERLKTGNRDEYDKVLRTGFCHMLLNTKGYASIQPGSFPETFGFDKERMIILEDDLNCMISITALLAVTACVIKDRLKICEITFDNDEQRTKHCKTKADSIAGIVGENVKGCNTYNLKEVLFLICFSVPTF